MSSSLSEPKSEKAGIDGKGGQRNPFAHHESPRPVLHSEPMKPLRKGDGPKCVVGRQDAVPVLIATGQRPDAPAGVIGVRDEQQGRGGKNGFHGHVIG